MKRVVIAGGGLSGLTAAVELATRGLDVTVLEGAPRCGGKLAAWKDEHGDPVEHGIHGWWPSYSNLLDLMARAGVREDALQRARGNVQVLNGGSKLEMLPLFRRLPSPLFLLPYFRRASGRNLLDFAALVRASLGMLCFDARQDYEDLDRVTFRSWLWSRGVGDRLYRQYFEPYVRSFAFASAGSVSAAAVLSSFHFYLLTHQDSLLASWLTDDPQSLIVEPLVAKLLACGGRVRTGTRVEALVTGGESRIRGVRLGEGSRGCPSDPAGELLEADQFLVALDLRSCQGLLRRSGLNRGDLGRLDALETTPVVVIRFWFPGDRLLGDSVSGHFVDYPFLDTFFVVSNMQRYVRNGRDTVVEVHAYGVKDKLPLGQEALAELALRDLARAFPELNVRPRSRHVLVHEDLVAHHSSGAHQWLPEVSTELDNLYLAGDWVMCRPAVWHMERAVVTGKLAASAMLEKAVGVTLEVLPPPSGGSLFRGCRSVLRGLRRGLGAARDLLRGDSSRTPPAARRTV
ncbi:MAG: FAD-dependent oxidoreductase [Planctomycetes bacterium]|nr:FAD-dependent oxidoreductase [Planctomycetota bacterium]